MKEALVTAGPKVQIVDSPIPTPQPDQVVIKVEVSGSNPKDWKRAENNKQPWNTGDDIAGTIHAVGSNVTKFHKGDRVAAFHEMQAPHGSFAEYAVAWSHTTFHLSASTSFEEAATIPLAAMTAALMLYQNLSLPPPWHPATTPTPLILYGASSAVGSFALQLASQSNIHPIFAIAGSSSSHVQSLLTPSKGDEVLDYRVGPEGLLLAIKAAVEKSGVKCTHALDTICANKSFANIAQALAPDAGSKIAVILPGADYSSLPSHVSHEITYVGSVHGDELVAPARQRATGTQSGDGDFAELMYGLMARGLERGWFKGQPVEVVPGGLAGVEKGLGDLKAGKASAVKYVFRVGETEAVGKDGQ